MEIYLQKIRQQIILILRIICQILRKKDLKLVWKLFSKKTKVQHILWKKINIAKSQRFSPTFCTFKNYDLCYWMISLCQFLWTAEIKSLPAKKEFAV